MTESLGGRGVTEGVGWEAAAEEEGGGDGDGDIYVHVCALNCVFFPCREFN